MSKKLVTPALKREWAEKVQSQFEMSERRACRLVEVQRFTKRYEPRRNLENEEINGKLKELAGQWKRFGYRRLYILLRRQGREVNHKRVFRLYSAAGLGIGRKRKKLPAVPRGKEPTTLQ